jgi:tRNA U34 2-thiouridine synthase MnmA/TrmU
MTPFRKLWNDAELKLKTYVEPNLQALQQTLNTVLVAYENTDITGHRIINVFEVTSRAYVETSQQNPCQCNRFEFPVALIDAHDPIAEAKLLNTRECIRILDKQISTLTRDIARDQQALIDARKRLSEYNTN